jgi:hypothetical protein
VGIPIWDMTGTPLEAQKCWETGLAKNTKKCAINSFFKVKNNLQNWTISTIKLAGFLSATVNKTMTTTTSSV